MLLDHVCEYLNLVEKDYFGLRFMDNAKHRVSNSLLSILSMIFLYITAQFACISFCVHLASNFQIQVSLFMDLVEVVGQ